MVDAVYPLIITVRGSDVALHPGSPQCRDLVRCLEKRAHLGGWIDDYDRRAPHSALGMRSPADYRASLQTTSSSGQEIGEQITSPSTALRGAPVPSFVP